MSITSIYARLQPSEVWRHFAALNGIPRPSRHEAAARAYICAVAQQCGAIADEDAFGNLVVRVPASPHRETAPVVAIQAHLDMVCEKRPDVEHDFVTDPIRARIEGERVYASGTTLGADNGIGAALALATLTSSGLEHGPLELIFTVEEEIGLNGANALDPTLIRARQMINLDSEDPEELTVGCAGGSGAVFRIPITREQAPTGWQVLRVGVSGLNGGHSGVQIHEPLANAIKLLVTALDVLQEAGIPYRIGTLAGGNAHNAIPRDAAATIAIPAERRSEAESLISRLDARLKAEWLEAEPGLQVTASPLPAAESVLPAEMGAVVMDLLRALPHGVLRLSEVFPGKVETSANLATVRTEEAALVVAASTRSFVVAELDRLQRELQEIGSRAGAELVPRPVYPAWEPNRDSELLRVAERVYREVAGHPAQVQVIHAGLECGIIAAKLPGMEAVSFGPLIRGAHTPEEYVDIPSVEATWLLLTALLAALSG